MLCCVAGYFPLNCSNLFCCTTYFWYRGCYLEFVIISFYEATKRYVQTSLLDGTLGRSRYARSTSETDSLDCIDYLDCKVVLRRTNRARDRGTSHVRVPVVLRIPVSFVTYFIITFVCTGGTVLLAKRWSLRATT
jgi:hypothetical protein